MSDYKEYLNVAVVQENRPVTYKALARSLGIHVNTAKQALFEFSQENESTVYAIYCVTGQTLSNDQFTIKLVKASDVEETKKSYKQITGIHVYSVTPFDCCDFSLLYPACKNIPKLTLEDRVKSGILKNDSVTIKPPKASRLVEVKKPVTPAVQRVELAKPATAAKPVTTTKPATKRKGTLSFGPTTNDIEMRLAKTSIKPEDIFTDDEDEEEEPQPEQPQEHDIIEIEGDDDDDMMDVEPVAKEETKEVDDTPQSPVYSTPGKSKRKVLRKKTTKNARGFLVTEEVWEWEEVSDSELPKHTPAPAPSNTAKPKPKAAANGKSTSKKAAGNAKSAAQTSLFSFFKKN
ncbi:hypothetical protein INT48_002637 [Thamnidium elegans]|uniref:DNA polymerase delta subunit 3 n=1 Tax=Thamnidium elegans TaxID=101142 RepID=A0A8H7VYK4_9FUNG|nr:hypothetical protein INT48_002637 [Thamnidium elegans]